MTNCRLEDEGVRDGVVPVLPDRDLSRVLRTVDVNRFPAAWDVLRIFLYLIF